MEVDRRFSSWEEKIEELDAGSFEVSKKEADFLESLLENRPRFLSSKQAEWLQSIMDKYGIS